MDFVLLIKWEFFCDYNRALLLIFFSGNHFLDKLEFDWFIIKYIKLMHVLLFMENENYDLLHHLLNINFE